MNPNDPAGENRRVYTDARFPDFEVLNDGGTRFVVVRLDRRSGRYVEIDEFKGFENTQSVGQAKTSEEFAARRARSWFDRLAAHEFDGPDAESEPSGDTTAPDVSAPVGRDFSDEQVPNADQILDMWEKAQAMEPGPEKDALMQQVRTAAGQLESMAEEVANRLLEVSGPRLELR